VAGQPKAAGGWFALLTQELINRAVQEARHKFDEDKPRGLYYILAKIFYSRKPSRRQRIEEIADAIDPT
jgi:hypothetical protein